MKEWQLVISEQKGKWKYWAYYCPSNAPATYALGQDTVVGDTIAEVIKKARKIQPEGKVVMTYLDLEQH